MSRQRLKIWPEDLEQIRMGRKRAEVRRCDDRKFHTGDELELEAFDPTTGLPLPAIPVEVIRVTHVESMAGPHAIVGVGHKWTFVPLVVLSFELL